MKFDYGQWMLQPGTEAIYPLTVTHVEVEAHAVTLSGYNHHVHGRGSFIDGTLITARFSSPMPNVIRVQLNHFKGRRERLPTFALDYGLHNDDAEVLCDETQVWLNAGRLAVQMPRSGEWRFAFYRDGTLLTASEPHAVGLFKQNGETYLREQLSLQVGETIYGLGERFGPFIKNGQSLDIWNHDAGTNSEYAYKNVPFYLTSQGYGVLVNHPGQVSYEVGTSHVSRVQFSVHGHSLEYYIFAGPTPKDALEQYTALSGRPPKLPDWSFGLWLSTSFTTNYNEEDILNNIDRMEELDIPISVFHFDCFWMRELTWTSFLWDERNFPDPEGLLRRIKEKGIKICLWINPYIAESSIIFEEAARQGYLLKTKEGDTFQADFWQPGIGLVDFTNPAAREWYTGHLKRLLDMGVDAFKTDFGERIPTDVVYYDGSDPERMHNYYAYLYNQTVFDLLRREKGEGEAVVFARSGTAGSQRFPVHWGGDNTSNYPSMAETLRGGLSLCLSGFGYWSHDISGFNDTATPDLYKRWVAFGLFSSHSRLHGANSAKMPWLFDDESIEVLRFFNHLKARLMPYLLDMGREASAHGWPMLRAMMLEFPNDPTCRYLDQQYMLGSALLVAPIFHPAGQVTYYLPAGEWRNLLTGEIAKGGVWRSETHDYFSLPLWVHTERGAQWGCLNS
ncbi:MAG: alpha-xylosidase [Chloroflexota bacterium]|nr:alpha-xylosidase [Chloroflexota bacterium]NOG64016.1 alpha-xylosidase [Chloroflexota bacterium]GIK65681.1 MAG: alpha-xylosidase [Chloroflexota bacterium]